MASSIVMLVAKAPVYAQGAADIAVLLPDSKSSARWENDDRKYFDYAFTAAGISHSIVNAEGDATKQATQADQAITNGAKVILLVNLDSGSGAAIIQKAHDAKIKIIDYDRLTIQGLGADFYVGFDNVAVGKLQGQGLVDAITAAGIKNPKIAELNGSLTDNNATLFKQGRDSVLKPLYDAKTYTKVEDQSVPGWDNQKALTIFEQMLTNQNNKIDAVLAANDGLAQAVISALENQKLPYIPLTGQDATVGGIQNVLAGKQSMTVYKAIKTEADAAAALAIALDKGTDTKSLAIGTVDQTSGGTNSAGNKALPAVLATPVSVTRGNVASTVIKDGFRTWAEVCVGDFAKFCPANWAMSATMAATAPVGPSDTPTTTLQPAATAAATELLPTTEVATTPNAEQTRSYSTLAAQASATAHAYDVQATSDSQTATAIGHPAAGVAVTKTFEIIDEAGEHIGDGVVRLYAPQQMMLTDESEIRVEIQVNSPIVTTLNPAPSVTPMIGTLRPTSSPLPIVDTQFVSVREYMGAGLRGLDADHFQIEAIPPSGIRHMESQAVNWWKWNIKPKGEDAVGNNKLEVFIYLPSKLSDGTSNNEETNTIPFQITVNGLPTSTPTPTATATSTPSPTPTSTPIPPLVAIGQFLDTGFGEVVKIATGIAAIGGAVVLLYQLYKFLKKRRKHKK